MSECATGWLDENDTEHSCCLNADSVAHESGGHACSCGERYGFDMVWDFEYECYDCY